MHRVILLVAMLLLVSPAVVNAKNPHFKGACKADVEKFCTNVEHTDGRLHNCLKSHKAELSQTCKANMKHNWIAKKGQKEQRKEQKMEQKKRRKERKIERKNQEIDVPSPDPG